LRTLPDWFAVSRRADQVDEVRRGHVLAKFVTDVCA